MWLEWQQCQDWLKVKRGGIWIWIPLARYRCWWSIHTVQLAQYTTTACYRGGKWFCPKKYEFECSLEHFVPFFKKPVQIVFLFSKQTKIIQEINKICEQAYEVMQTWCSASQMLQVEHEVVQRTWSAWCHRCLVESEVKVAHCCEWLMTEFSNKQTKNCLYWIQYIICILF